MQFGGIYTRFHYICFVWLQHVRINQFNPDISIVYTSGLTARSVTAKSASSINCAKGSYNAFSSRSDVVDKKLCLKVVQTTIRFPAVESGLHYSLAV